MKSLKSVIFNITLIIEKIRNFEIIPRYVNIAKKGSKVRHSKTVIPRKNSVRILRRNLKPSGKICHYIAPIETYYS